MADPTPAHPLPGLTASPRLPWESIMESVRNGVICLDGGSRVVYLNRAMEDLFQTKRSHVIGNLIEFAPELGQVFREAEQQRAAGMAEAIPFRREFTHHSDAGNAIPMTVTITEALNGEMRILIGVVRDLSNLKRMEEALVQSRKSQAIGALAGGISHDFNNILTALLSQLDLALDDPQLPGSAREHILQAQTSGRRAAELISRLQTFSRQTETRTTTVDLAELIAQVELILRRSLDRRIQIKIDPIKAGQWLVKADASQVIQVVFNLALNARDAMPAGGVLSIHLERVKRAKPDTTETLPTGDWVRLTVRDSGRGMSPEVLNRAFEPYFTTKTIGRGTGLGLSIAQSMMLEQGGWMEVESEPGKGSQMHVFLPEIAPGTPATPAELHQLTATDARAFEGRETILIADDEEMVRLVMKAVLSYRGYKVVEATDGSHLFEVMRGLAAPPDLLLLDVDMPRRNGWEALQHLKAAWPDLPVIMLSGGAVDSDSTRARERGAVGFLAKPFKNEQLVQLVRKTLDAAGPDPG